MKPYVVSIPELAERLGVSRAHLCHLYDKLYAAGMPRPVRPFGRKCWDRSSLEAWLQRDHPLRPKRADNDEAPNMVPSSDDEWRAHFQEAYGPRHS